MFRVVFIKFEVSIFILSKSWARDGRTDTQLDKVQT